MLVQEHPETMISMNNLAVTCKKLGRVDNSIDLMADCVELRMLILGIPHLHTQKVQEILDTWRRELGGLPKAMHPNVGATKA